MKIAKYWDDFLVGDTYTSEKRTVLEEDVERFAEISEDMNPLHLDENFAKTTPYGKRIVHGMLVLSKVTGLHYGLGVFKGTSLGVVEIQWKFKKPVFIGDSIQFEARVENKIETSKKDRGILIRSILVRNEHGEIVQEGKFVNLIRRK
ncbi:MaoC family dehydratase [Robertmurraya massiliosenegalensis]|uniref:MaoC family dehydratase n=1 Tax=Robertmurraya massiliosenegalensis TaxID=1287657 RepID=UPI0003092E7F|nr:MaoC/PaaZ C-terminal domain-containing protein [Robertmurraya massiliosenegalensis]